jgi:hypothetical protein
LESRLLLTCIRPDVQPDTIRSLLRGQPNWQAILEQATSLGVETLVYAGLKLVSESGQPPEEIVEQLGHAYRRNAARNLVLMDDLGRVLTALSEMGIPVIVLKGAALAELVYSGVGLRKMVDLDLLVQRPDLDTAESLLQRLGYRAMGSHSEWDRHHHHIIPYMSPTGSSVVEIHHHIHRQTPLLAVSVRDLWSRAGHARIASVPTQVRIPMKTATDSDGKRPPIPIQSGHFSRRFF